MARPDARLHLPNLRCPTLVVCGDSDQLTPPDCSDEIAALVPGAQRFTIAQCGHMLTMEQPDAVNAALLQWLHDEGCPRPVSSGALCAGAGTACTCARTWACGKRFTS
jgi:alpha-beta hydrolase superfamily lysophospholipase